MPRRVLLLALAFATCGVPSDPGPAGAAGDTVPAVVLRAERMAKVLDDGGVALDLRPVESLAPRPGSADTIQALSRVAVRLVAHLDRHGGDARGWVALARLVRLQQIFSHFVPGLPAPPKTVGDPRDTVRVLLSRAHHADSTSADAYFWEAVLLRDPELFFGTTVDTSTLRWMSPDYAGALAGFSRAHELRPNEDKYRAAYVHALTGAGRYLEAERIEQEGIDDVSKRHFVVARLLRDWEAVPTPPACVGTPAASLVAARGMRSKHSEDPSNVASALRWRQFACTMPADSLVAFYRSIWPGASFQRSEEMSADPFLPIEVSYAFLLRWDGQTLVPIEPSELAPDSKDIVSLLVMQLGRPGGAPEAEDAAAPRVCLIWCVNDRILEP